MLELCVERIAMSTRVALPLFLGCRMSELRRQVVPSPAPAQERTAQVRKNLFGPIDHDENIKFVQDELNKISQADCKRWNFDFQAEKPKEGRYSWERVGEAVPQAYAMPRLRYLATTSAAATSATTKPTPIRKVPEAVGTSPSTSAVDQPATSSPTTTATSTTATSTTATSTTASSTTATSTTSTTTTATTTTTPTPTTTTALSKPTRRAESRLPTTISSSASSSESSTSSRSISKVVVVKKCSGGVDRRGLKSLPTTVRRTRARAAQLPVTDFMKIRKSKRAATTKLEEEQPPALVKRPKTTSS